LVSKSGLQLINGGSRAEVDAAHIRLVEASGPDITSNGMALSGAAHWMFDRGLIWRFSSPGTSTAGRRHR
jgi:putative restriction endonuclease